MKKLRVPQGDKERARYGHSRQREHQIRRAEAGLCYTCEAPAWRNKVCIRCAIRKQFSRLGISGFAVRYSRSFDVFVAGMAARYERILVDEGFAVDAIREPEKIIEVSGVGAWAKRRLKRKVLEVIQRLDDKAIRERMRAATEVDGVEKRN